MGETIDDLQAWVGRERIEDDELTLFPARGMAALLDRDPDALGNGLPLPHGWHWLYFKPLTRQSDLGDDGHERRGAFLPPVPMPRRMWAAGRMRFLAPLVIGQSVERISAVESITEKQGRSGALVFVVVRHRISGPDGLACDEEQTLVYREVTSAADSAARAVAAAGALDGVRASRQWTGRFDATEAALFRFSALTFNGHRIHYDQPYATDVEGHAGIVVHAPLLALLLLDGAVRAQPGRAPATFVYRATSSLFAPTTVLLEGAPEPATANSEYRRSIWRATDGDGRVAMSAALDWRS